jgi:hypothetical protein
VPSARGMAARAFRCGGRHLCRTALALLPDVAVTSRSGEIAKTPRRQDAKKKKGVEEASRWSQRDRTSE